ncbi:MAG TPA: hypothetical protein DET67_01895, partial [Ruegeria sp.]|nr:hypothetical protein [Ruegeria sp.]
MKNTGILRGAVIASLLGSTAMAAELTVPSGGDIQAIVDLAAPGDTILVEPGAYHQSVYVDKPHITLRGLRKGDAWALLDGEMKLNDGIIASGHSIVIDGFKVTGYKGNGIMTQGANNFEISNNYVEGAFYGIFPQFGRNGLVVGNTVTGAEDAGIYVGMSDNVDVIDNVAFGNVMGIEFENTRNALMAGNHVYDNAAGITLTLVPGLPVKDAHSQVIRDNRIIGNNHENFAPASSIAAGVPSGTGILVVGPDNITIVDNEIADNDNVGVFVADLITFGMDSDPKLDPYSDGVRVLGNTWRNNGENMNGMLADMLTATGRTGIEVLAMGKGRDSCVLPADGVDTLGTNRWQDCADENSAALVTARIEGGADEPVYTREQKGRLTYLAVCTGCHAYDSVLHGPSVQSIQALYDGDPSGMVNYISN